MEPSRKKSLALGSAAMDWQGPATRRAGIVVLLAVSVVVGVAIAGLPGSGPGHPKLIVVQSPSSSSSTVAGSTTSGPSTSEGPSTTAGRGVTTTTRKPAPTTTAPHKAPSPTPKPTSA